MENILHLDNIEDITNRIHQIRESVHKNGWAIIRGLNEKSEVKKLVEYIKRKHNIENEVKVSGNYKRNSSDFQRFDVGEFDASSRLNRYFMFFPWNNDKIFESINKKQISILRALSNKGSTYGDIGSKENYNKNRFIMSYVIQYPTGGGFMSTHREYNQEDVDDRSHVVYLALTEKNIDFESGGAFVFKGEKKCLIEDHIELADMVIYRGDYYHGVESIDREKHLNLNQICGRMILTTVFKYFQD